MAIKNPITQEGYEKLIKELNERKIVQRDRIANDIETARAQGDLSENAAYSAAMTAKEFNENRITELEDLIANSEVVENNSKNNSVELGEEFVLVPLGSDGKKMQYRLVGANESNPQEGKISADSPIGNAVVGKSYGSEVTINLPSGEIKFKIERSE